MSQTKIEWADAVWNPVTGCTKISEGCQNCYAERMAKRLAGRYGYPKDEPFRVTLHLERLEEPLRWRKPRRIFVCSMGDLFHRSVPNKFIGQVFDIMGSAECEHHTFLILTKRPERWEDFVWFMSEYWEGDSPFGVNMEVLGHPGDNIWMGVSVENQKWADERIPILLQIPAKVRFVSCEPLLSRIDLTEYWTDTWGIGAKKPIRREEYQCEAKARGCYQYSFNVGQEANYSGRNGKVLPGFASYNQRNLSKKDLETPSLSWVILGGETGPGARPMHPDWVRSIRNQCQEAGVPFFFKQWGEWASCDDFPGLVKPGRVIGIDGQPRGQMCRVGKKAAGRMLDGRFWEKWPDAIEKAKCNHGG